jgi:pimeloyl-ACP methyl ester carboxylesterase
VRLITEAIPALLNHLGIKHVSIGCHSGGTVFGLDFAVHNPQFLHPSRPYIAIAGPWIHPSRSGMIIMSLASSLPRSLVAKADKMATFVNSTLGPVLGVSAAVSGSVMQLWPQTKPSGCEGPDVDFEEGVRDRVAERVFEGNVRGLGQETQVLLRKGAAKAGWSDWGDFDVLAPRLAEAVRSVGVGADADADASAGTRPRLKVDVFFAEKDTMIGDAGSKGPTWFEACWRDVDGVEFASETVKGADHDHVWDLRWGVMERVLKTMTQGEGEEET